MKTTIREAEPADVALVGGMLAMHVRAMFGIKSRRQINLTDLARQDQLGDTAVRLVRETLKIEPDPIPMRLNCPDCGALHLDVGEWARRVHHTHTCQNCGLTWRPAIVATVGVQFLPGFKNEPDTGGR